MSPLFPPTGKINPTVEMEVAHNFLESQCCPVCGGNDAKQLFSITHRLSNVLELLNIKAKESETVTHIVKCNNCPHYYMTPVIKEALMSHYYSIITSEFYHNNPSAPGNYNHKEYKAYSKTIESKIRTGKILEIGCGNGYLLQTLKEKGFDCYGIEPSPLAYNYARNILNLNVENKFLHQSSFYNESFDVIIMIDVAEHISDMHTFMKEITKVLKPGGYIFIGTGNIDSFNAKLAGADWGYFRSWEHVSFFNPSSLALLLNRFNFEYIAIKKTNLQHYPLQNITELGKNFIKKIVNPFLSNRYYHGICFDHLIAMAQYKTDKKEYDK